MSEKQKLLQAFLKWCFENQQSPLLAYCRRTQFEIGRSLPVWDREMGLFRHLLRRAQ